MYKKVITMTAYKRPSYTKQVVDNLKKCIGFDRYLLLVNIEPGYPETVRAFDTLSNCNIVVNERVLGCATNTLRAIQRGFEMSDFVIHLEDDTVPGIDSLKYFEWVYNTYKEDKDIFTATAYNMTKDVNSTNYFTSYRWHWFTPWMWCTWIDRFEEMAREWDFTAWDNKVNILRKDRCELCPHVARSQNIGEYLGVHVSPDYWRQNQYNSVWINSIPNVSFDNMINNNGNDNIIYTEVSHTESSNGVYNIRNIVSEGYRSVLKRDPDPGGLDHYADEISSGRISKERFLEILRTSKEYKIRFG